MIGSLKNAFLVVALLSCLAGCLGENRKLTTEKKSDEPVAPTPTPLMIYREIVPPGGRANTVRLSVERNGRGSLEHGNLLSEDAILPEEREEVDRLVATVKWADLPVEYLPPPSAPLKATAATYEVTYNGPAGSRSVTTHDGIDSEDEGLVKLRKQLQRVARRLEDQRR